MAESSQETPGDGETKSTKTRHPYTGTILAFLLVGTSCATVLLYASRGTDVPLWATATFGLTALTAAAWAFGESALRAASDARGGK